MGDKWIEEGVTSLGTLKNDVNLTHQIIFVLIAYPIDYDKKLGLFAVFQKSHFYGWHICRSVYVLLFVVLNSWTNQGRLTAV